MTARRTPAPPPALPAAPPAPSPLRAPAPALGAEVRDSLLLLGVFLAVLAALAGGASLLLVLLG